MSAHDLPQHVAIVMDGNGRWAEKRKLSRNIGHQAGLRALRRTARHGADIGIKTLTVFAFSSENWNRPPSEVSRLMDLFMNALDREMKRMQEHGVRLRIIGDLTRFRPELRLRIQTAQELTSGNTRTNLNVAANYGGRWDILNASRKLARAVAEGRMKPEEIDETRFAQALSLPDLPEPDLLIRTGGEMRISNFMLWQSAYTELYFSKVLWPDFDAEELDRAIAAYRARERRFGMTGEQLRRGAHA
jgi:undecaprenyl diphosphate synthase